MTFNPKPLALVAALVLAYPALAAEESASTIAGDKSYTEATRFTATPDVTFTGKLTTSAELTFDGNLTTTYDNLNQNPGVNIEQNGAIILQNGSLKAADGIWVKGTIKASALQARYVTVSSTGVVEVDGLLEMTDSALMNPGTAEGHSSNTNHGH